MMDQTDPEWITGYYQVNNINMDINELLNQHKETIDAIFQLFEINDGYGEINDHTSDFFTLSECTVNWHNEKFDPADGGMYANEIRNMKENDTHYLLYVDNGCGDKFYQIFDKSKQL